MLYEELLTIGLDLPHNQILNHHQNGVHFYRFYEKTLSNKKRTIISPLEYRQLLNLQTRYGLVEDAIRVRHGSWHLGSVITQGQWSFLFHYTSHANTYFHGIGPIANIRINSNIGINGSFLRYVNRPILVHNVNLQSFLEISNDVNLLPVNLSNLNVRQIVEMNNNFLRDVYSNIFWHTEFVIQLNNDGNFERISPWTDYRFFGFYERLDEVINNQNEINRQINNIVRDVGQGLRRIRDV